MLHAVTYSSVPVCVNVSQIAGPFIFGILLSKYDPKLCVKLAVGAMVISLPILVCILEVFLLNLRRILIHGLMYANLNVSFPIINGYSGSSAEDCLMLWHITSMDNLHVYLQLNLVDITDRQSKGTLQRPKHAISGDKTKGSTDGQHEEAGTIAKLCVGTSQWLSVLMLKSFHARSIC